MTQGTDILVIHGDPEARSRLTGAAATVRAGGFLNPQISSASTLAEAMKVMAKANPKLIFVGLDLADSKGMSTLRAVRAKCVNSPIVAVVGDDDHATGAETLGNGAQDYLYASESTRDVIERSIIRTIERRKVEEQHADNGWRSGIGQTALGIRHEINNPLAALMLNLEMLKEGGHDDADELLQGIEIAAKRIAGVVRRLEGLRTPQRIPAIGGEAMVDLSRDESAQVPSEGEVRAAGALESAAAGSTILLVDDEESVRAIVTKILGRQGHNVLEAEHGAAALRLAAGYDGTIDLLITDMYMPGLRGPEILEKLRPSRPGLRVLFMSGYADEDVARSGVQPGSSFLRKPFTVQELSDAVKKTLASPA